MRFPQASVENCVENSIVNVTRLLERSYGPFCTRVRRHPNDFVINSCINMLTVHTLFESETTHKNHLAQKVRNLGQHFLKKELNRPKIR